MSALGGLKTVVAQLATPQPGRAELRKRLALVEAENARLSAEIAQLLAEQRDWWNARLESRHLPSGAA